MVINRNLPFLAAGDGTLVCSAGKVVVIIWADLFHRISLLIFIYSILMVADFYPGCKKRIFYFVWAAENTAFTKNVGCDMMIEMGREAAVWAGVNSNIKETDDENTDQF